MYRPNYPIHWRRFHMLPFRPGTGENWAEKVACEIAALLGITHAHYDLAVFGQRRGVITSTISPKDTTLIHGNEILGRLIADYEKTKRYHANQHTLRRIHSVLDSLPVKPPIEFDPKESIITAFGVFTGYLMLDALIGNQDRHHENWGLILQKGEISLAPTFDHASSLGRNETDANRTDRLTTKDQGRTVTAYAKRARSAIYAGPDDTHPMGTLDAFTASLTLSNNAYSFWLNRLRSVSESSLTDCVTAVPDDWISQPARDFACELLRCNRDRLLNSPTKTKQS